MPTPTTKIPLLPARRERTALVEVTPGKPTTVVPPAEIARVAIHEVIPTGEPGVYRHQARIHAAEIELTTTALRKLGLGIGLRSLKRLIKAGFVRGCAVTPQRHVFSLESYFAHCSEVRRITEEEGEFWTEQRLSRFRTAM